MSSCLCKKAEGVIPPLLVKAVEDGEDDVIAALGIDETDHSSRWTAQTIPQPVSEPVLERRRPRRRGLPFKRFGD
jgi:hypothetical protein